MFDVREVRETPGDYVTGWRMTRAQALIRDGVPLKLVGEPVGYASQADSLRAFKLAVGATPSNWLRRQRSAPALAGA